MIPAPKIIKTIQGRALSDLAVGFLRYEALRKLKPYQFEALHKRNLAGEFFDDMVDELIENEDRR